MFYTSNAAWALFLVFREKKQSLQAVTLECDSEEA